jgi:mRNA-degrading endonuclease RelE of RelBE toxin-antitoxin system
MLEIERKPEFLNKIRKVKDNLTKDKIKKQIFKIVQNPEIGKPMMYGRKGTRELYIKPFRISYSYLKDENKIIFLDLYHKNKQ